MSQIDVEWKHFNFKKLLSYTALGYIAENAVVYPFWVIKTKEQISTTVNTRNLSAAKSIFLATKKKLGFKGLYKGFWTSSLVGIPSVYTYLLSYHYLKDKLTEKASIENNQKLKNAVPLFAGFAAEILSLALFVPVDVVTQKLQLEKNVNKNGVQIFSQIIKNKGFLGLYQGFSITFVTYSLSSSVWWLVYENTKTLTKRNEDKLAQGPQWNTFLSGIIAGSCSIIVTQPLDVVKTRMQTTEQTQYRTISSSLKQIYNTEGIRGFLRGLPTKLIGRMPLQAFLTFTYETVLYFSVN
eukprot:snap_masked-scaffold_11-processed-gene-2.6-mRNA-1 protein AED:1.00 eAED:1.00 QI:0/-1/0/0/-1/1/1/0/295